MRLWYKSSGRSVLVMCDICLLDEWEHSKKHSKYRMFGIMLNQKVIKCDICEDCETKIKDEVGHSYIGPKLQKIMNSPFHKLNWKSKEIEIKQKYNFRIERR